LPDVEDEARNFAEDLGAMLDEIDFAKMSDLDKDNWLEDQPIFGEKRQPEAEPRDSRVSEAQETPAPPVSEEQPVPTPQPVPISKTAAAPAQSETPAPSVPPAPVLQHPQPAASLPEASPAHPADAVQVELTVETSSQISAPSPGFSPLDTAAKKRLEIMQEAIESGVIKAPKQPSETGAPLSAGVVSRDREALARLFTSF
ncbi:MAG TPA: hypothetical protein VF903_06660, partial [Nitrospirota bacterium]